MSVGARSASAGQQPPDPVPDIFDILGGGPSLRLAYVNACKVALPDGAKVIPEANRELVYSFGDCVNKKGVVVAGPAVVPMLAFMWWAIVYNNSVADWFCTDPGCAPVGHLRQVAARHLHAILTAAPGHMQLDAFVMQMLAEVHMLRPVSRATGAARA